ACFGSELGLRNNSPGSSRRGLQVLTQLFIDNPCYDSLDLAVAQLRLGLSLKLGIGNMSANDRRQAFFEVFTGDRQILVLSRCRALGILVQGPRQCRSETSQMCASLDC